MPFLNEITQFINQTLKAGSLNNKRLQPSVFHGIASTVVRKKPSTGAIEYIPAIINENGRATPMTPDSKTALQVYHRLFTNTYSYERKSYGDSLDIKSVSELAVVVFTNSKISGKTKDVIEPAFVFGLPQRASAAFLSEFRINKCLITPLASNMDHVQVYRQEFPNTEYFLNEQVSMFLIRYRVEMTFSQACVDHCLCDSPRLSGQFTQEFSDELFV